MNRQIVGKNLELTVSPLSAEHLPEILQINAKTNAASWSQKQFLEELSQSASLSLGLLDKSNRLIGFIFTRLITTVTNAAAKVDLNQTKYEVELLLIAVDPKQQNRGFGKILLHSLIERIGPENIAEIFLEVRSENLHAVKFYEKFGFSIKFTRKNYYHNPIDNALIMTAQSFLLNKD